MDRDDHARSPGDPVGWPGGWNVEHVAETGSTNADLLAAADRLPDRSVLVADHQTAGRGRLDRTWEAPPGANLLVSILFRDVPADPGELTRRVGLAAVDAVGRTTGRGAGLKWPNDVLLDGRKLGGILAQRAASGAVVVGLGLNVGWAPQGAAALDGAASPAEVLAELLSAYDRLPDGAELHERYRRTLVTIGQRVRVELPGGEVRGTALDVAPDGALMVLDECAVTHRVDVGDVVHLRTL